MEEKKGEDIILLDIKGHALFADYFIICSGTSDRMLRALSESVGERVYQAHELSARLEGVSEDGWLLLDYGDIIVHLFSPEKRNYYRLEELWSEGKVLLHVQ